MLVALALALWQYALQWRPSPARYPAQGIDVSHHQSPIDWRAVRQAGARFAFIKATEGADYRDPAFAAHWSAAADAGFRRGAYHFFTLCRDGAEQASNFIGLVPADRRALPPVVDLEFGGNCSGRPSRQHLLASLGAFLSIVEAHAGQRALLYVTREFDEVYGVTAAIDRPLWLRRLILPPAYGARPWAIWQASSFRQVPGVKGRVDWNVMAP